MAVSYTNSDTCPWDGYLSDVSLRFPASNISGTCGRVKGRDAFVPATEIFWGQVRRSPLSFFELREEVSLCRRYFGYRSIQACWTMSASRLMPPRRSSRR
jgi:hypothetical protein